MIQELDNYIKIKFQTANMRRIPRLPDISLSDRFGKVTGQFGSFSANSIWSCAEWKNEIAYCCHLCIFAIGAENAPDGIAIAFNRTGAGHKQRRSFAADQGVVVRGAIAGDETVVSID